jgi:hypothetical protein
MAAIFLICERPPARPVSGWITSTSSRSMSARMPQIVANRSPAAMGISTRCWMRASASTFSGATGSSKNSRS